LATALGHHLRTCVPMLPINLNNFNVFNVVARRRYIWKSSCRTSL